MKRGAGDNPFEDDPDVESPEETTAGDGDVQSSSDVVETQSRSTEESPARESSADEAAFSEDSPTLPYIYQRETVKDGRDQIPFFLREPVQDEETTFINELEDELGEHVYKADAREAALLIAFEHPGEVAELLRQWGYDH